MEIVIILLLIAAVAFVVYFQLKGSRPDVIPVQHLSTKKSPKKTVAPKKEVVEQWDPLEVSKKKKNKKTDDESPKKKKKERYDPVAEGKKVLKSETLKKRETVAKADDEKTVEELQVEKKTRNRLAADGFVVIDEKKAKSKKSKDGEDAAPVEKVVEEAPLSEFEERLKRLRDVVSGMRPPQKDGDAPYKPRGDKPVQAEKAEEETTTDAAPEKSASAKSNAFMKKQIEELRNQQSGAKNVAKGGMIKTTTSSAAISAPSSGKRGWEKVVKKAAPAPVEEAAEEEAAPVVEEEAAPAAAEEEWGNEPEAEEF